MLASTTDIISIVAVVAIGGIGLATWFVSRCVKIVQQGSVGVVKRFGEFRSVDQPGLRVLRPFVDKMEKVDMREFPMTGDQQAVITKDNVSLQVSATIFCQVIDVKSALFEINDYQLAVDQLSRTALRAVIGEMSLDQALSERETINTRMQDHMADATVKWGVRLNRIEILDITPPANVVQAMSEQKEAEQHKKATILKSVGHQQRRRTPTGGRARSTGRQGSSHPAGRSRDEGARASGRGREEGARIAGRR
jgi:regulator of protease activity HflC (stomatin/prohibitin superfamily)